jgi:hypothetical protein
VLYYMMCIHSNWSQAHSGWKAPLLETSSVFIGTLN